MGGWPPSSELALRWFTATVLLPPIVWVCYWGGWPFVAVVTGIVCVAISEFYGFIRAKGAHPQQIFGTAAAASLPAVVYLGDAALATSFLTAVLLVTLLVQLGKRQISEAIASISATFFGVFYIGWLFAHGVSLRFISQDPRLAGVDVPAEAGVFYVILTIAAALGSDAAAYFAGRRFGRHKLAPGISPGKTIEGAVGGLLGGAALALGTKAFFDLGLSGDLARDLSYPLAAGMGAVLAGVAVIGDLIESLLKRDAQLKDAGHVLPGIGGVLDRIDSALLAFPVMYYMLLAHYYLRAD